MILNSISSFTNSSTSSISITSSKSNTSFNGRFDSTSKSISNQRFSRIKDFEVRDLISTSTVTSFDFTTKNFRTPRNPFGGISNSIYGGDPFSNNNRNVLIILYLDLIAFIVLGIEFTFRTIIHPNKIKMLLDFLFYLDIIAIFPYFIYLWGSNDANVQCMYFIFNIFRVFLLLKFFRHIEFLKLLSHTVIKSYKEMIIYVIYVGLGVLIFSSFIYYIESSNTGSYFYSIPGMFLK
jgi:hypothetical protein